MTALQRRATIGCFLLGWTFHLLVLDGLARGQANIVFMTGDSMLSRFDMGNVTFSTGVAAGRSAFLGVTVLNGDILVSDYLAGAIQRFAPNGTHLGAFTSISNPTFLESDSSGSVYTTPFSTISPEVAMRFDSTGAITQMFTHPNMTELAGIDADAAGNVYIADNDSAFSGELYKFAADGTFLNSIPIAGGTRDLAIDETGNRLFAANETAVGTGVHIFDISGTTPIFMGTMLTPALADIVGVHFAAESGNILATDFGATSNDPRGLEYSPAGVLLREYRTGISGDIAWDITTFVPEPSCLGLLGIAALGLWFHIGGRSVRKL